MNGMSPGAASGPREGVVGQRYPVWAQRRGQTSQSLLGDVEIEDLSNVLTRIAMRRGSNGPQGLLTQFILASAADHLDSSIVGDVPRADDEEHVPRTLSALIGHEPFVEHTLELSVNQMRRRWPRAADWYHDLIAYVLRPQRHRANMRDAQSQLREWLTLPFGQLIRAVFEHQISSSQDAALYRLADTLRWLWPHHPAVREAQQAEFEALVADWSVVLRNVLWLYALRFRHGVDIREACWLANALVFGEAHQRSVNPQYAGAGSVLSGTPQPLGAQCFLTYMASVVTDEHGTTLTVETLRQRCPERRSTRFGQ